MISGAADIDPWAAPSPTPAGSPSSPALAGLAAPSGARRPAGPRSGPPSTPSGPPRARAVRGHRRRRWPSSPRRSPPTWAHRSTALRVDGGLTRSALLMQAQADLLSCPVEVSAPPDVTALGVGAVARLGPDPRLDAEAGVRAGVTPSTRPSAGAGSAWRRGRRGHAGPADAVTAAQPTAGRMTPAPASPEGYVRRDRRRRRGGGHGDRPRLARHRLRIALVDASDDVGNRHLQGQHRHPAHRFRRRAGHAGGPPGRARATTSSRPTPPAGIPVERIGALLVAWDDGQLRRLPGLAEKAARNGYPTPGWSPPTSWRRREPHLGPGALGALEVPGESIICPWTTTARVRHPGRARRRPPPPATAG